MASINDLATLDLRIGKIIEILEVEGSKKLYRLKVDLGELGTREIAAGIKSRYSQEELLGKNVVVVTNLEPKKIASFVSQGMLLAADDESTIALLGPDHDIKPGSKVR